MCGVVGVYGPRVGTSERVVAGIAAASRAIVHRGPDDDGSLRRDDVVFGFQRLSIIDLSSCGHQPMGNESGDVWIVFNGEIYNHLELRNELIAHGHRYRSSSDTESIIHGYEQWGIDGLVRRLRGMFAFALYDARAAGADSTPPGKLYLARDRFGIKPMYYSESRDGGVVFGSEVRALIESALVDPTPDPRSEIGFLLFGSVPAPLTTRRQIRTLPPGHYLALTPDARLVRYYDTEALFDEHRRSHSGDAAAVRQQLDDAIRIHLISDAPLGVFLSGGIDSSALVGLAATTTPDLRTVSIVFDDARFSEKPYQDVVQKRFRTRHHEIHVSFDHMAETLDAFFSCMDQPTVDGLNTYFVARAARQAGLTVVLSGLGGDEVFGGYDSLRRAPMHRRVQQLPSTLLQTATRFAPRRVARKLDFLSADNPLALYLAQRGLFSPREVAELLGTDEQEIWNFVNELQPAPATRDARSWQQLLEFRRYLPDQLLRDSDVFGMAHSLEIRVPFLDHVLVELVLSFATVLQRDPTWPKPLLTKAIQDLLPPEVVFRRKQGFTFPFAPWLMAGGANLVASLGASSAERGCWNDFTAGREHWSRPWALYVRKRYSQSP